jgi:CubicO group peptidase (beta-lactamase class C family)
MGTATAPKFPRALQAIGDYADAHRRFYNLPGLTLSVTAPDGFSTTINQGFASLQGPEPIGANTLFQIGSITKCMTAAVLHQLAFEGRVDLDGDARPLLPDGPWPDAKMTVQQLIDHVSGLPGDGPAHLSGGRLSLTYKPGEHWWYSNLGYVLLGRIAERAGGAPLRQLIGQRILSPLGMAHTRGAVTAADRLMSAQGYEPYDRSVPYVRGSALRPSP